MAYNIRVHNPGPYEVVMDMEGRIVAGHSTVDGDRNDKYTARLISRKVLLNIGTIPAEETSSAQSRTTKTTTTKSAASTGAETGEK